MDAQQEAACMLDALKMQRRMDKRRLSELKENNVTQGEVDDAIASYAEAGISMARVHGKGWRLFAVRGSKPGECYTPILWEPLSVLVNDVERLIEECNGI